MENKKSIILMKQFLSFCIFLLLAIGVQAQEVSRADIQVATDAAAATYQLQETQLADMYKIQERRLNNLSDIAPLKDTKYYVYLKKLEAIRLGTEASLKRLLDTEQRKVLYAQQVERRKRESALIQQLKAEGVQGKALEQAVLELNLD